MAFQTRQCAVITLSLVKSCFVQVLPKKRCEDFSKEFLFSLKSYKEAKEATGAMFLRNATFLPIGLLAGSYHPEQVEQNLI